MWARRECFGIASVVLHRRVSYVEVHRKRLPRTPLQRTADSTDHVPMHNKTLDLECLLRKRRADSTLAIEFSFQKYHIGYLQAIKISSTRPSPAAQTSTRPAACP
jgi:hypothetical protein